MSSGVNIRIFSAHRECEPTTTHHTLDGQPFTREWGCEFVGVVDVAYDPETGTQFWECPKCGKFDEVDPGLEIGDPE